MRSFRQRPILTLRRLPPPQHPTVAFGRFSKRAYVEAALSPARVAPHSADLLPAFDEFPSSMYGSDPSRLSTIDLNRSQSPFENALLAIASSTARGFVRLVVGLAMPHAADLERG
jgi:hypothetical protein